MKIAFYGAAGNEVTGSAYHCQTDDARILVDFGIFQGAKMAESRNRVPAGLQPKRLNAVLLTHAHLDHCGRLPLLSKRGFSGPVHATKATLEIADLILRDSAKIQSFDVERLNRRRERGGQKPLEPLYSAEDVEDIAKRFHPVAYDEPIEVAPGIRARFLEAGHMIGSACIELTIRERNRDRIVVFSGDIGQWGAPLLRDPFRIEYADAVFMESTYGDHDHRPFDKTVEEFTEIVKCVVQRRGKLLVPTFAVGRTQQLLYHLAVLFRNRTVPKFPVFVDSPMAVKATRVYAAHPELGDDEVQALRKTRPLRADLTTVQDVVSPDDSRKLNDVRGPCMIMAGAGMCNAGRILHHLKYNLWRPETTVAIVGYQAPGSLGRRLVERQPYVSIFRDRIAVKAAVRTLGGFSAHAGQSDLLRWIEPMASDRVRVFLTHGEEKGRKPLAKLLRERYQIKPELPEIEDEVTL
jgi:metallo-beta-lactamase family protein